MVSRQNRKNIILTFAYLGMISQLFFLSHANAQALVNRGLQQPKISNFQLPSQRYEDYDLENFERLLNQAEQEYNQAQRQYSRAEQDYQNAQNREREINQNFQQQARALEINEKKERDLNDIIRQKTNQVQNLQQQIPQLQNKIQASESQVNREQQQLAELEQKLASAPEAEKADLQKKVADQKQALQLANRQLNNAKSDLEKATQQLSEAQREVSQAQSQIPGIQAESQRIRNRLTDIQRSQAEANQRTQEFSRILQREQNQRDRKARDLELARRNYDTVRQNIEIAARVLRDQGSAHGARDGRQEGTELGSRRGQQDGDSKGQTDGRDQGTQAGQQREFDTGYRNGSNQASSDAFQNSNRDAQANGTKDGTTRGTADGLKAAYDRGMQNGLEHGARTGDDKVAYAGGKKEGEAAGLNQAVIDARPQYQLGYNAKENEYLTAPLKEIIVGDQKQIDRYKGLQGRYSNEGDDRYYRPQPGSLPHPRLQRFYIEAYDESYRNQVSQSYSAYYRSSYDTAYRNAYDSSYSQYYNQRYADSEKQGYNRGYQDTYQVEYNRNYTVQYRKVYDQVYDKHFNQYKNDQNEINRGFKDGNQIASRQKGYDDGYKATYAANINIEKQKAFAAGSAAAQQLYTQNAVIKVSSVEIKDANGDGIFRPGEEVLVLAKLKNFGLKAKTNLESEISQARGVLQVSQAKIIAASIAPQSDATVYFSAQGLIAPQAIDGNPFSLAATMRTGQEVHLAKDFSLVAQYPAKVELSQFDGILIPGVKTTVKMKVTNRSQRIQDLKITVGVDTSKVQIEQSQLSVLQLAPGSSREVQLKLTGNVDARFEETFLTAYTVQNTTKYSMDLDQKMTIIQKHSPTTQSKGLIISSNLALGAGKKLFALDKFDTWDLRVDGAISQVAKLDPYKAKILHILADPQSLVDAISIASLRQFIANNGSMIVWGSRLDQSQLGQSLMQSMGIATVSVQTFNGEATGIEKLAGLKLQARGTVTILKSQSAKAQNVLSSASGNLAVISFGNGAAESVGQAMVVGIDILDLENSQVQLVISAFERARLSFTSKLGLAVQNPGNTIFVVQDMLDEMVHAEIVNQGSFYKNNRKGNKLYKAGAKLIGESGRKSAQASELAKFYPKIMNTLNTKLSKEQWQASLVLEERHGNFLNARNLRDLYCADKSNDSLCTQDNNR